MASVEVMTACENVCRDFEWLGGFSDWGPALLASTTAFIIAFYAYPWQKERDRKLQIALEQRTAYKDVFDLIYDLQKAVSHIRSGNLKDMRADIDGCFRAKEKLERGALKASMLIDLTILNMLSDFIEEAQKMLKTLATDLAELLGEADSVAAAEVSKVLEERKSSVAKEMDDIVNRLLNAIRKYAFNLPGQIRIRSRRLVS
ncbi:hypothetical protein [Pseudophaeobacter leonis]|uniref:hypothetical protein n=1 Tax=Pseudophaeobacter leonis TaxID=1144477 RepID=UPI0009F208BC|nr:hypothetical protein [Pseudophaeobacter leonis]